MDEDFEVWDAESKIIRNLAEPLLEEYFGERCGDFEPDCVNCQRWKALDDLLDNPFKD